MAEPDFDSMSVEDLDNLMRHPDKLAELTAEPVVEVEDPPAPPVAEEPPTVDEPEKAEPEPDPEVSELDILRAKVEEALATAKKMDSVAGRATAENGYLRGKLAELQGSRASEPEAEVDYEPEPPARPRPRTSTDDNYLATVAIDRAANMFRAEHPGISEEATKDVTEYVKANFRFDAGDGPRDVEIKTKTLLVEGLYDHQARQRAKDAASLETRRADQMRALTTAKAKATISGSGSPPPPIQKPKTTDEMSLDELDAELKRLTADQRPSRRI